jgi:rod shape-determining protein MreD
MMALSADNKRIYIRRAVFALLLLATAVIQNTKGFLPEPFGVRAFPLIPLTVCLGMHERDVPGLFFGLGAGLIWDAFSAAPHGYYAFLLMSAGFLSGALIATVMRNNIMTALLLTVTSSFAVVTLNWLITYVFNGYGGAGMAYLTFYLPSFAYTLLFLPLCFYAVRVIKNKLI